MLLSGNRHVIAAGLTVGVFIAFSAVVASELVPLTEPMPSYYALGALVSGNLTLITVVVSINQLLLSRELKAPGELTSQIDSVIEYRQRVEDAADRIASVEPLGFLRLLYENTRTEAQQLGGLVYGEMETESEIRELVENITAHADAIDEMLVSSDASTFQVLSATLTTNYANQIHHIRLLWSRKADALDDAAMESLDRIVDRLQEIDVARQYFKSVYRQQELSSLSRVLLYAGLPAVVCCAGALLFLTSPGGTSVSVVPEGLLLTVAFTVGLVPLVLLFSYILRAATVTRRTAATQPFTTPEQETDL